MRARDYVLGTDDDEVVRLGRQHDVWRPIARDAWRRAGVRGGSRVIDVGAGPGFATRDLVDCVGPAGVVHAVERSERFVAALEDGTRKRATANVRIQQADLSFDDIGARDFDVAWCRWVACFVTSPARLVRSIGAALKPDGVAVFHEYVDYASWRFLPRFSSLEEFVTEVMASWRAEGGEPDIARQLPSLLIASSFAIVDVRPLIFAVRPRDPMWQWPAGFVRVGARRLNGLHRLDQHRLSAILRDIDVAEGDETSIMITPTVLEIIAQRR